MDATRRPQTEIIAGRGRHDSSAGRAVGQWDYALPWPSGRSSIRRLSFNIVLPGFVIICLGQVMGSAINIGSRVWLAMAGSSLAPSYQFCDDDRPDLYMVYAAQCLQLARETDKPSSKALLLEMASKWLLRVAGECLFKCASPGPGSRSNPDDLDSHHSNG
jgi:hypothetical protein